MDKFISIRLLKTTKKNLESFQIRLQAIENKKMTISEVIERLIENFKI